MNERTGGPAVSASDVARVAIVRPRFLGDLCLTLPLLDAVRAACPGARVAYVVERESAALLERDPRVDELVVVPRRPAIAESFALIGRLRRFAPDLVFDLFCNPRTAQWTALSGARFRVGYPNKGWRSRVYTHHARPRTLSAIGFHLASLEALGWPAPGGPWSRARLAEPVAPQPRLRLDDADRAEARRTLAALGVPESAPLVGFHPGARWPTRRWDPARFAALAGLALADDPARFALVTAGPGEAPLAREIAEAAGPRAVVVADQPVRRFVAIQSCCDAFVSGDTGPLHTAVAAGAPTLGLLTRNRPAMFFPYAEADGHRAHTARVECSPCDRDVCADLRCLHRLTVEGAWALLEAMLARAARRAGAGPDPRAARGSP